MMYFTTPNDPDISFQKGFPLQSYDLGMGFFDHQSYKMSGGVWILRGQSRLQCPSPLSQLQKKHDSLRVMGSQVTGGDVLGPIWNPANYTQSNMSKHLFWRVLTRLSMKVTN